MKTLEQESEEAMEEFYHVENTENMIEIPSSIKTVENRRIWAYQEGYTAIGYSNRIWYAYNN